jgi:adenosylhomocysteine nucleosidase
MIGPDELIAAVDAGDTEAVSHLLTTDPSLANSRGKDGVSALLHARYRPAQAVLDAILAADPEMDVFDAAAIGQLDRLRRRLDEDPDRATAFAADGFTALHLAAFFGQAEAARTLLETGASVSVYGRNGFANQPLHAAAAGRHFGVCRLFLAAGANVNATQHGGYSPLHEAAGSGDVELAELFLSAGANALATTETGATPAAVAAGAGHHDLAARLRQTAAVRP